MGPADAVRCHGDGELASDWGRLGAFYSIPATQLVDTHCYPLILIMASGSPTRLGYDTKLPAGAVQSCGVLSLLLLLARVLSTIEGFEACTSLVGHFWQVVLHWPTCESTM